MDRGKAFSYDRIQKAMEDVRRDRLDYYLDILTGEAKEIPVLLLEEALGRLYHELEDDYERDTVFDSEVNMEADLTGEEEEVVEMAVEVLLDPNRFIRIPERDSDEAFEVMTRFAMTVKDSSLKKDLITALNGSGAFRRFKDVLLRDRKERKRWHGFNAKAMKEVIDRWYNEATGGKTRLSE
jgi:hypothetical protein